MFALNTGRKIFWIFNVEKFQNPDSQNFPKSRFGKIEKGARWQNHPTPCIIPYFWAVVKYLVLDQSTP